LIAGAAMALSSAFVLWNSSRLRRVGTGDAGSAVPASGDKAPGAAPPTQRTVGGLAEPALAP
jgi:hypothetical protein